MVFRHRRARRKHCKCISSGNEQIGRFHRKTSLEPGQRTRRGVERFPSEESAWIVHIDPERPWLMAFNMGRTSSPRTSPTMTRSAFIRSALRTRRAIEMAPSPSALAGRASRATRSGCRSGTESKSQLKGLLDGHDPFVWGMAAAIARINVVLPEFIAPPTTMFFRARTAADRKLAIVTSRLPISTRSSRLSNRHTDDAVSTQPVV